MSVVIFLVFIVYNAKLFAKNIKFYGDFFGKNEDLSEIENLLKDTKYTREAVKEKLETVDIGKYFSRFTVDEVVEVIVE